MTSGIESKVDAGVAAVNQKLVVTKDETDKAKKEEGNEEKANNEEEEKDSPGSCSSSSTSDEQSTKGPRRGSFFLPLSRSARVGKSVQLKFSFLVLLAIKCIR